MGVGRVAVLTACVVLCEGGFAAHYPSPRRGSGWSWGGDGGGRGGGGEGGAAGHAPPSDYQVVYLPALLPRETQRSDERGREYHDAGDLAIDYRFDAFGRNFDLKLVPNRRLLSPHFKVFSSEDEGERHDEELSAVEAGCHYLHSGAGAVAAISACQDQHLHGLIFVDNSTYELSPLTESQAKRWDTWGDELVDVPSSRLQKLPHVIRKAPPLPALHDDALPLRDTRHLHARKRMDYTGPYTIEVALFFDEAAYKLFYPYFNYNERDLRDMLLAYVNGVQALYHHPSLGSRVELSLVRLQLMRSQPPQLPTYGGERSRLLDSFCAYQKALNREDDEDPDHWDMALLLSGLDFYAMEKGKRSGVTMGLAPVGGVCLAPHACVVAEIGTSDSARDWPSPAAGFSSVYVLAHEIGHNLGMHHDSRGNACARDGYIMSPSRGYSGEALWSACSAQVVQQLGKWAQCLQDRPEEQRAELAHHAHRDAPGAAWGAKRQCEMFLRDRDAAPAAGAGAGAGARDHDVCQQLTCRTPHRADFFFAGPALPGTACGQDMWCQGGECVPGAPALAAPAAPAAPAPAPGGWGAWQEGGCRSGCVARARGHRVRRRVCGGRADTCEGASSDVMLCDDTKVCSKKTRVSAGEFAARKCSEFASKLSAVDARGGGLQAPHDPTRMWMGCAIFCRRAGGGGYYAPRAELHDMGADPYFPDGTWCHRDAGQDYYCLQHHCLPENFKLAARWQLWDLPQNPPIRRTWEEPIAEDQEDSPLDFSSATEIRYPSAEEATESHFFPYIDGVGYPLLRHFRPENLPANTEAMWEHDYVDIPSLSKE